jgi:hypothetical protein
MLDHDLAFVEWLCRWPEQGGANELLATFGSAALSYFVCSSVGFRLHDSRIVSMDHDGIGYSPWQNISRAGDGYELLGAMNPINVLEPIETLVAKVAGDRVTHDG